MDRELGIVTADMRTVGSGRRVTTVIAVILAMLLGISVVPAAAAAFTGVSVAYGTGGTGPTGVQTTITFTASVDSDDKTITKLTFEVPAASVLVSNATFTVTPHGGTSFGDTDGATISLATNLVEITDPFGFTLQSGAPSTIVIDGLLMTTAGTWGATGTALQLTSIGGTDDGFGGIVGSGTVDGPTDAGADETILAAATAGTSQVTGAAGANVINAATQGAVTVEADSTSAYVDGDKVLGVLVDAADDASAASATVTGTPATINVTGINAASLADGVGTVDVYTLIERGGDLSAAVAGAAATKDATAPSLSSAAVNGISLVLTYSETLAASTPATTDYVVDVGGSTATVDTIVVSGTTVTLTLAASVGYGTTVTLDYTPGANPIQDAVANPAVALTDRAVTNNTPDATAPSLSSAAVNGTSLVLTYNESLDEVSTPATGDFAVDVGGSSATVNAVAVSGTTVTLTLAASVGHGTTVTLDYVVGAQPIQDVAGNDAAALTDRAVTNNTPTPPDTTAPSLSSAAVNGTSLVLTYNEALDGASPPATTDYTVKVGGSAATVNTVAVSGTTVTLTLAASVGHGTTVTLDYTAGGNPIQDAAGNDVAALTDRAVANNTPNPTPPDTTAPRLVSATVNGTELTLTYNEKIRGWGHTLNKSYILQVDGSSEGVPSIRDGWVVGTTTTDVILSLSGSVGVGTTVTLSYSPDTGYVTDLAENHAPRFENEVVTNNTPDTTPPSLVSATINGKILTLTYNEDLDGESVPGISDYMVEVKSVMVNSQTEPVSVALLGRTVTLTLAQAVLASDGVFVYYYPPTSTTPAQDVAGNDARLVASNVINNTGWPSAEKTTEKVVVAGGSVSTGEAATTDDPVQVAVVSPNAGTVKVTRKPTTSTKSGFSMAGVEYDISAPDATPQNPLRLTFRVDNSAVAGGKYTGIFRNGTLVTKCEGATQASPDPCWASVSIFGDDWVFTVLTSKASVWNIGTVEPGSIGHVCPQDTTPAASFGDVAAGYTHGAAIDCIVANGITQGTSTDAFSPSDNVTRAQMATFVVNLLAAAGVTLPDADSPFVDIDGNPHADSIARLAEAGIVSGRTATTYDPRGKVTREQMATYLVNAYEYVTGQAVAESDAGFSDVAGTHASNVGKLVGLGVTVGATATEYEPKQVVDRGQMASFLARTLNRLAIEGFSKD